MAKWLCGLCIQKLRKKLDGKHRNTEYGNCHHCGTLTELHKVK